MTKQSNYPERNIDAECLELWNRVMDVTVTTSTKIRAIVDREFGKRVLALEREQESLSERLNRGFSQLGSLFKKKK